jgi:hypothetical protein
MNEDGSSRVGFAHKAAVVYGNRPILANRTLGMDHYQSIK